jgi:hypothetical protein
MTYSKPEVVILDSSVKAIQGANKPTAVYLDNHIQESQTVGAYESDE